MIKGKIIYNKNGHQVVWGIGVNAKSSRIFLNKRLAEKFAKEHQVDTKESTNEARH